MKVVTHFEHAALLKDSFNRLKCQQSSGWREKKVAQESGKNVQWNELDWEQEVIKNE